MAPKITLKSGKEASKGDEEVDSKAEIDTEAFATTQAKTVSDNARVSANTTSGRPTKRRRELATSNEAFDAFLASAAAVPATSAGVKNDSKDEHMDAATDGDGDAGGKVGGGIVPSGAGAGQAISTDCSAAHSASVTFATDRTHANGGRLMGRGGNSSSVGDVGAVTYKSVISGMARANKSNVITVENYYLLLCLRHISFALGIRFGFLHDHRFLWGIYRPMMQSAKKLKRTDGDIRVAADLWGFDRAAAEERYGHISDWDVSSVTDMSGLLQREHEDFRPDVPMEDRLRGKDLFNDDISRWDVSNVTTMKRMFYNALSFNHPIDDWDVSNVTNMEGMFYDARAFNQPVGDWDVSKVTKMKGMFEGAECFNQAVGDWNMSNVINMNHMFCYAAAFNQPVGDWDVPNVTDMGGMFAYAAAFNHDVGDWDVSKVTDMSYMFEGAQSFNQDLTRWDMRSVTTTENMFDNAPAMQRDNKPAAVREGVYDDDGDGDEDYDDDDDLR